MTVIGTATRTTQTKARQAFAQGKTIMVSDSQLHLTEVPVGEFTTTINNAGSWTWTGLLDAVRAWGRPQRFYLVEFTPEHLHETRVAALLHQGCTRAEAEEAIAANDADLAKWHTGEWVDLEHSMST